MKLKIYIDTSVINFLFADDAPEKKEVTIDFFKNYLDDYDVYISRTVINEILRTPNENKKSKLLESIKKYGIEIFDDINSEIIIIAEEYINKNIIPKNQYNDTLHLAFATFYEFDILLSWNFKHLANFRKQEKVNLLNTSLNYRKYLFLLNPMELVDEK